MHASLILNPGRQLVKELLIDYREPILLNELMKETIVIVGAGPAGLFCAYELLQKGHEVKLFDHSSGAGKKFLVAGAWGTEPDS